MEVETTVTNDDTDGKSMTIREFVEEFGRGLLAAVNQQNPPIYDGIPNVAREAVMLGLKRAPFDAQRQAVQSVCRLLMDEREKAAIINGEMGTGKTMMAIATAAVLHAEGFARTLIICPPHLVYKWKREILSSVADAKVCILNGPDTIRKLNALRKISTSPIQPEFYVMGRVRMRMGFNWRPAFVVRKQYVRDYTEMGNSRSTSFVCTRESAACPTCGTLVKDPESNKNTEDSFELLSPDRFPKDKRVECAQCGERLWSLMKTGARTKSRLELVTEALCQLPTIGPKTAQLLIGRYGEDHLEGMLGDNVYEFLNLLDDKGDFVFPDRQMRRMERALGNFEFSFGTGGYQPTEFVKRYLPADFFALCVVDEVHEYKSQDSAQGQAMAVLASQVQKVLVLTGTLMGGYADDLFYLLQRIMPQRMIEDGYRYNQRNSLAPAAMVFMRDHGILKDVFKETEGGNHRTARGKKLTVHTKKAPGFGPKGVARYVLPYTVFLKLRELGENILPPYTEHFIEVPMNNEMAERYNYLASTLKDELKKALRKGDRSLLGVVLNSLLAWPDTCFRPEQVRHPRKREILAFIASVLEELVPSPKEEEMLRIAKECKARGRRVLVYTTYTGTRDTTSRLKALVEAAGLNAAVLRASVDTQRREDWIQETVDRGVDVLITNPDLVRTGLDLLEFPTIVFMQTGYNVYTLMQAARRSWRIGQKEDVDVIFLGYGGTTQIECLKLMQKKITVCQSTSGDMPESGLDILNQDSESIEVALAKQLIA